MKPKKWWRLWKEGRRTRGLRSRIAEAGGPTIGEVDKRVLERWKVVQGLGPLCAIDTLVDAVYYALGAGVRGDLVEFGTATGRTSFAIARAATLVPPTTRRLHLFDSFAGLPEISASPDLLSPHVEEGAWAKGGCAGLAEDALRRLITTVYPKELVLTYAGWFSETVARLPNETRFALIHFDGDLYQSTIDALGPLFARGMISPGAILLFDDWNCNRADPRYGERRAWAELVAQYRIDCEDMGAYGWSGRRFIVQGYPGADALGVA